MSLLDAPQADFSSFMVADWGVDVTIEHKTVQIIDPATGDYANTTDTETHSGIVGKITSRELALFPNTLKINDKIVRVSEDDFVFVPSKGDKVTIGSVSYTVIEIEEINNLLKLYVRKH